MSKVKIQFSTDNAAFEYPDYEKEIRLTLFRAGDKIMLGESISNLFDTNGNKIGTVEVEVEE